jgi:hypothetical protein
MSMPVTNVHKFLSMRFKSLKKFIPNVSSYENQSCFSAFLGILNKVEIDCFLSPIQVIKLKEAKKTECSSVQTIRYSK